jgi:hypothetical protein
MTTKKKRRQLKRRRQDPNLKLVHDSTRALAGVAMFGITANAVTSISQATKK